MQVVKMKIPMTKRHLVILPLIWWSSELPVDDMVISIPLWRQPLIQEGRFWLTLTFPVLRTELTVPDSMKGLKKSRTNMGPEQMGKG